jgi:hypothetical protein
MIVGDRHDHDFFCAVLGRERLELVADARRRAYDASAVAQDKYSLASFFANF